jgi:enoyl-CoA hydratase/carnithine racemase
MTLLLERDGPIGRIIIDRPEKRNAFNQEMWERMPVLVAHALADRAIKVIVLQSAVEGVFCAGADVSELMNHRLNGTWRAANQAAINRTQYDLARAGKPTIAFVDGDCVGGGCGLAIACDFRFATRRARFGITPAKLGLVYPLHDTKLLIDLVGPAQAKRMLFTGELLSADEAYRIGLADSIGDDVSDLATRIAANSSHSMREMKLMVRRVLDGQVADDAVTDRVFAEAFTKPDFVEGASAFLEKRKAEFK